MSTYEDASLIYYPSGVKAGTAYSLKPTDGTGDLTFTRASTATRVNESGLIESVATGVPRIDYTGGGCGKLLLEPQRTNLVLRSEEFDNAYWNKTNATVSANTSTSPDGTTTADKLIPSATPSVSKYIRQIPSATNGLIYFLSVFAKAAEYDMLRIEDGNNSQGAWFNLSSGTVGTVGGSTTANIEALDNGWYRCTISKLSVASSVFFLIGGSNTQSLQVGDGTSGILIWGAQLEQGSYSTSLINTTTTAVTRVADKSTTTGLGSIIGQTEGTIYLEGIAANINADLLGINRSSTNAIFITKSNLNAFRVYVYAGGVGLTFTDPNVNTSFYKLAITYKSGNSYLYVNGVKIGATNTSTFTFSAPLNLLELAGNYFVGVNEQKIQGLMIFPEAKSEAEVAALTTL